MDNNKPVKSSLRNNIMIAFLLVILFWSIATNYAFRHVHKELLITYGLDPNLVQDMVSQFVKVSTGITIIILIVAMMITYFISRNITLPIKKLTEGVNEVAKGNWDVSIDIDSQDELKLLADSFNTMTGERKRIEQSSQRQMKKLEEYSASLVASQQKLSLHVQQTPLGVIEWDLGFRVVEWNKSAERIFGYSRDEALGRHAVGLIVSESLRELVAEVWEALLKRKGGERSTNENLTKDGRNIICEWYNTPLVDEGGNVIGVASLVQDITEKRLAQEHLKASLQEKELLLREIHHRVKNNMQIIISLIRLQESEMGTKDTASALGEIKSRIMTMSLVHEELYKSEDFGKIKFRNYINVLSGNIVKSYRNPDYNIQFFSEIEDIYMDIDTAIPCGLIINELLTNAFKHAFPSAGKHEVHLGIKYIKMPESGGYEITLRDNGIGIPEEVDIKDSKTLGLNLVQTLAEIQLDGNIELSRDGGTTFRITFPDSI